MDSSNPYAAPQIPTGSANTAAAADRAWRSGELLVLGSRAVLPDRCVKCNGPAEGYRRQMRLAWHSRLAFLGLLLGLLPYIIIAVVMTRRLTVQVGICRDHVRKRRMAMLYTLLLFIASVFLFGMAVARGFEDAIAAVFLFGSLAAFVTTLVYGIVATRLIWPSRIDKEMAWVKGASPEYLAELPEFVPSAADFRPKTGRTFR